MGEWATPKSRFSRDLLTSGSALYLLPDGMAGFIGAPPPIGVRGEATYDPQALELSVTLLDDDSGGRPVQTLTLSYHPGRKTLTPTSGEFKDPFKRRKGLVPDSILADLQKSQARASAPGNGGRAATAGGSPRTRIIPAWGPEDVWAIRCVTPRLEVIRATRDREVLEEILGDAYVLGRNFGCARETKAMGAAKRGRGAEREGLTITEAVTGKVLQSMRAAEPVLRGSWRPDSEAISYFLQETGTNRRRLFVWELKTDQHRKITIPLSYAQAFVKWSPDGKRIAFTNDRGGLVIVDPVAGSFLTYRPGSKIRSFDWDSESRRIAAVPKDVGFALLDGRPLGWVVWRMIFGGSYGCIDNWRNCPY